MSIMKNGIYARSEKATNGDFIIEVNGVIGWDVGREQMRQVFKTIPEDTKKVIFDIYSPGGSVWVGNAIISDIGELNKKYETVARIQVAASMATLLAVACQKREMAGNGRFLVHNPWMDLAGDAGELEKRAEELRATEIEAATFYASRSTNEKTASDYLKLMAEEKWLTAQQAMDWGFISEIINPFDQNEYKEIKDEMLKAGKFPMQLVELDGLEKEVEVKDETNETDGAKVIEKPEEGGESLPEPTNNEDKKDDGTDGTDGTTGNDGTDGTDGTVKPVEPVEPVEPEVEVVDHKSEYKKWYDDGVIATKAELVIEKDEIFKKQKEKIEKLEILVRTLQSKSDKLESETGKEKEIGEERVRVLKSKLEQITERYDKLLEPAMLYTKVVETWDEAMSECNGDYVKARQGYPLVYKAFMSRANSK